MYRYLKERCPPHLCNDPLVPKTAQGRISTIIILIGLVYNTCPGKNRGQNLENNNKIMIIKIYICVPRFAKCGIVWIF